MLFIITLFTLIQTVFSYDHDHDPTEEGHIMCPEGCPNHNCHTDYTCASDCDENYENDGTCMTCKWVDPWDDSNDFYVEHGDVCVHTTNVLSHDGYYVPYGTEEIDEIKLYEEKHITINNESYLDTSPCNHQEHYLFGQWLQIKRGEFNKDLDSPIRFYLHIAKINEDNNFDYDLFVDISASKPDTDFVQCTSQVHLDPSVNKTLLDFTEIAEFKDRTEQDEMIFYVFVCVKGAPTARVNLTLSDIQPSDYVETHFYFTQEEADWLAEDLSRNITVLFPFKSQPFYMQSLCAPDMRAKMTAFNMNFTGNYYIRIDSFGTDRMVYLQEHFLDVLYDENGKYINYTAECKQLWSSHKFGAIEDDDEPGLYVRIDSTNKQRRFFTLMTEEPDIDVELHFRAICPNNCDYEHFNGYCNSKIGSCRCRKGYGGDDCHLLCSYDGKWQGEWVNNHGDVCWAQSENCDSYCKCAPGYHLSNNLCLSDMCGAKSWGENDQCYQEADGCMHNCYCDEAHGWRPSGKNDGKCKHELMGNGKLDQLKIGDGPEDYIQEECDGGTSCTEYGYCVDGTIPDPNDPGSCYYEKLPKWAIILVVVVVLLVVFIIGVAIFIVVKFVMKNKNVDLNVYRTQQPPYHYYLTGSKSIQPGKDSKYDMDPVKLDFGNVNTATNINDTRYQDIELKNASKNKYMMVIFHTPNNPKFVFHFDPQVVFLRPRTQSKMMRVYMTLKCTTKIRDMKIPYTIWWSKSIKSLKSIAELLKDKTFESWSAEDKEEMDFYIKDVNLHIHNNLTIVTDAASSTHIDMDELNMSEQPFAEGANGRVYIGNYRSVPVAVKQFNWDYLTDEEIEELKADVINECEIMAKLRNPFIANYMGSVTYLPQISMVIQFFVLGSLGEYLRKTKEDYLKFPYKLKVRMLFDTARGMQFLHENKIMHLDLKPDNLLVNSLYADSACCIKITDFGTSRFTKKGQKSEDRGLGTPVYSAPETYKDNYTNAGDVYSFAITAWEVFYQDEPFKDFKSLFEIKDHVLAGKRLEIDDSMPSLYSSLLLKCWCQNPEERISFDEIARNIVKIDDDVINHPELDNEVNTDKIEELIAKRTTSLQKQLRDLSDE